MIIRGRDISKQLGPNNPLWTEVARELYQHHQEIERMSYEQGLLSHDEREEAYEWIRLVAMALEAAHDDLSTDLSTGP